MRKFKTITSELAIVSALALMGFAPAAWAQEASNASNGFASDVVDFLNGPGFPGPLSPLGDTLHAAGFKPTLNMIAVDINDGTMGRQQGKHESLMMFNVGMDADLQKVVGLNGSAVHFRYLFVPGPHDNGNLFGSYGGDSIVGNSGPFIPYVSHLTKFTWEQKFLGDRLDIEGGKDNAGEHFAKPLCNGGFLCQGLSLQDGAGFAPPPYANLSGRVAYQVVPEVTAQVGYYRYNPLFPFTKGWEGVTGSATIPSAYGPGGNDLYVVHPNVGMYLGNVVYETTYATDPYPKHYELMLYHNDGPQTDPYTSQTHKGTNGMYLGARQTVWREQGNSGAPRPMAVSLYSSWYTSFDSKFGVHAAYGLQNEVDAGVILDAPFASRPFDSYSAKVIWHNLSSDEEKWLKSFNTNYTNGPNEVGVGVDANFMVAGSAILNPWVLYVMNPNVLQATENGVPTIGNPKNGVAFGVNLVVLLDKMLGL